MAHSRFGTAWRPARVEGPRPQGEVAIGGATPPGASITFPILALISRSMYEWRGVPAGWRRATAMRAATTRFRLSKR